mgnify:CR=1 FL=1
MAWMAKQIRSAGTRKTPTVDPSQRTITIPSMYQLSEELGIPRGGQSSKRLQEQLRRLLYCHISIRQKTGFAGNRDRFDSVNMQMVKAVSFLNDNNIRISAAPSSSSPMKCGTGSPRSRHHSTLVPPTTCCPAKSVLPYDVYVWLTGTFRNLRHDLTLDWDWLHGTFRRQHQGTPRVQAKFREALKKIQTCIPPRTWKPPGTASSCTRRQRPSHPRRNGVRWTRDGAIGIDRPPIVPPYSLMQISV